MADTPNPTATPDVDNTPPPASPSLPTAQDALGLEGSPASEAGRILAAQRKRSRVNLNDDDPPPVRKPAKKKDEDEDPPAAPPATPPKGEDDDDPPATPPAAPPATPPATPKVTKIVVDGKEYTEEELKKLLTQKPQPAPQPAPQPPAQPKDDTPKGPTPEELAAARENYARKLNEGIAPKVTLTEPEMEAILGGGQDAIKAYQSALARNLVEHHIYLREEIANELNPILQSIHEQMVPLAQNFQQTNEAMVESMFRQAHPEFEPHLGTARAIAQALTQQFPNEVRTMTPQQFVAEVARQTENTVLAPIKATAPWFNGTLKEWNELAAKFQPQAAATPPADGAPPATPPATPPAAPAASQPPAAPPAAPVAKPRVPAANPPASAPSLMATHPDQRGQKGFHSAVAASLRD